VPLRGRSPWAAEVFLVVAHARANLARWQQGTVDIYDCATLRLAQLDVTAMRLMARLINEGQQYHLMLKTLGWLRCSYTLCGTDLRFMTRSRYYPDNLYKCYVINAPVRKLSLPETAVALSRPPLALLTTARTARTHLSQTYVRAFWAFAKPVLNRRTLDKVTISKDVPIELDKLLGPNRSMPKTWQEAKEWSASWSTNVCNIL
jgi:hypothetical protein